MTPFRRFLAPAALLALAGAALPALAASSAASSASESLSTSVGSVSDSFKNSSESSDRPNRTADGDYKVIEVAAADQRPGTLRLTLQPADGAGEAFELYLPQKAAEVGGVAVGQVVSARNRDYGVEFARADNRQPFFLVLEDAWYQELASNPVTL
ncbi:hypothetical protein [Ideonella sp.]|uniref:hypothetical protein n=1 Tax=Ideonella sp. TaxID=1929293 RepID=UPI0035AFC0B0